MRLRVPLTLAILPGLVVKSSGQSFCVPQGLLAELLYVSAADAETLVQPLGLTEVFHLRESLLPMVRLEEVLGSTDSERKRESGFYLVIFEVEGTRFGLAVDDLMAPEEIVIKPLSPVLRAIGLFSGGTVLGNGTLALILDVPAIAASASVRPAASGSVVASLSQGSVSPGEGERFLVFERRGKAGIEDGQWVARHALPLGAVERIESVALRALERVEGRTLLRYQGELLPVEDTEGLFEDRPRDQGLVTVLICRRPGPMGAGAGPRLGLAVSRVLDIASGVLLEQGRAPSHECLVLVGDRITAIHQGFEADAAQWRAVA